MSAASSGQHPPTLPDSNAASHTGGGRRGRWRRIKCTYPSCRKYGHFTSQCWVAQPELRPADGVHRRICYRCLAPGQRPGRSAHATPINSDATSALLAQTERTPSHSRPAFRFLDLPQEIQHMIYAHAYADGYRITVRMLDIPTRSIGRMSEADCATRSIGCMTEADCSTKCICKGKGECEVGCPATPFQLWILHYLSPRLEYSTTRADEIECNLAFVSKKLRRESRLAREHAFDGTLTVAWDPYATSMALKTICGSDEWASLRAQITDLRLVGLSRRSIRGSLKRAFWRDLPFPGAFPNVNAINLWYDVVRRVHKDRHSEAPGRPAYTDESEEAAMDYLPTHLEYLLKVRELGNGIWATGPVDWSINLNKTVTWLDNCDRGDCNRGDQWVVFPAR
ncbi:hypothetical protein G647_02408 [Cladophialophora carrionii CBS 160.54]|uniref:Uncharacterized protein n=1 Tax=Cladophialophora carrionii CBS 160.54 TaxID=1279043 RepID=V9DFG5_9EURO|nr:uncharacterized protein G647_02408 [Cladophialophora carrionii CBS 160.54]ETI25634.1 hypothetical protein G647_02408 [Cladophialophora carrionii CBS 160.54]